MLSFIDKKISLPKFTLYEFLFHKMLLKMHVWLNYETKQPIGAQMCLFKDKMSTMLLRWVCNSYVQCCWVQSAVNIVIVINTTCTSYAKPSTFSTVNEMLFIYHSSRGRCYQRDGWDTVKQHLLWGEENAFSLHLI